MGLSATVRANGRLTIPKQVRDELGLDEGDRLIFRVQDGRAVLTPASDLLELAGSVQVPADAHGLPVEEVRERVRRTRSRLSAEQILAYRNGPLEDAYNDAADAGDFEDTAAWAAQTGEARRRRRQ